MIAGYNAERVRKMNSINFVRCLFLVKIVELERVDLFSPLELGGIVRRLKARLSHFFAALGQTERKLESAYTYTRGKLYFTRLLFQKFPRASACGQT